MVFGLGVVGVALLVFCLVAVGFVFFCCVFLPGGIVALRMKLQWSYGRAVTGTAVMARSANEEKKKSLPIDMQGRTHPISGYRLVHWSPDLKPGLANNHMEEAEARNLVALTRSKGLCLLLFPTTHVHPTGPLHSLRTLCALRHGMFHIGKDRVDLDSFAAFLTQPDTVEFAHDGITIDSRAPFTRESWLFTHQITSYGAWTFLPLALRLTMHSARFELTLALRQEVPKPSCFQVTPDLFHWQGHLLDGVRVTLSFGIGCLELASDTFV